MGKKAGSIKDIVLDFRDKSVDGFSILNGAIFSRKNKIVWKKNIVYFDEAMVVEKLAENDSQFTFSVIKGMEVIDICGNIIGVVEDLIFDERFCIRGILICPGIVRKIIDGKRVLLVDEVMIGDKEILYYGKGKFKLISVRHGIDGEDCND
jgi:Uncharacterized protein conserved in bacteria